MRTRESNTVVQQAVARTIPDGLDFMYSTPDLRVDPGFGLYLPAESWSQHKVFQHISKYTFPESAPPNIKAVWATLADWYSAHQLASDLSSCLLITWPHLPHMAGL